MLGAMPIASQVAVEHSRLLAISSRVIPWKTFSSTTARSRGPTPSSLDSLGRQMLFELWKEGHSKIGRSLDRALRIAVIDAHHHPH